MGLWGRVLKGVTWHFREWDIRDPHEEVWALNNHPLQILKDVKGESLFTGRSGLDVSVRGEPLLVERTLIYYLDEKPPQFSMKRLTGGLIAVIVVVVLALVAGVAVLVITNRRKSGKYRKVELKELGELRQAPSL
ncbi:Tumor-associated calcium signal transducer 2 [Myotis brandtii]|uniref:Tumor-associated calcium signal transducer 2 n=1 Tax=Myotis brandtii TaxID=109478 RepID=S7MZD8_MYOBR|nr:Tumor-associated calcium signal transducer 2 [Myotis brandtii]